MLGTQVGFNRLFFSHAVYTRAEHTDLADAAGCREHADSKGCSSACNGLPDASEEGVLFPSALHAEWLPFPQKRKADGPWIEVWKKFTLPKKMHQAKFLTIRWSIQRYSNEKMTRSRSQFIPFPKCSLHLSFYKSFSFSLLPHSVAPRTFLPGFSRRVKELRSTQFSLSAPLVLSGVFGFSLESWTLHHAPPLSPPYSKLHGYSEPPLPQPEVGAFRTTWNCVLGLVC